jgi:hypothetical protein
MRNNHGEGRSQAAPRQESSDIVGAPPFVRATPRIVDFAKQRNVTTATQLRRPYGARTTKARRCATLVACILNCMVLPVQSR